MSNDSENPKSCCSPIAPPGVTSLFFPGTSRAPHKQRTTGTGVRNNLWLIFLYYRSERGRNGRYNIKYACMIIYTGSGWERFILPCAALLLSYLTELRCNVFWKSERALHNNDYYVARLVYYCYFLSIHFVSIKYLLSFIILSHETELTRMSLPEC